MTQQGYIFYRKKNNQAQSITATMLYAEHDILRSVPSHILFIIQQFKESTTETSFLNERLNWYYFPPKYA